MMVNFFPILQEIKQELTKIENIKSLKIGLEKGVDKAPNAPLLRLVVEKNEAKGLVESLTFQVIIAFDTKNDLELRYEEFYYMEHKIKNLLCSMPYEIYFLNTISDEDRLTNLKAGVMRFRIENLVSVE